MLLLGQYSVVITSWNLLLKRISINLLVVYRESVNLIGYITRRLSAVSKIQQLIFLAVKED